MFSCSCETHLEKHNLLSVHRSQHIPIHSALLSGSQLTESYLPTTTHYRTAYLHSEKKLIHVKKKNEQPVYFGILSFLSVVRCKLFLLQPNIFFKGGDRETNQINAAAEHRKTKSPLSNKLCPTPRHSPTRCRARGTDHSR